MDPMVLDPVGLALGLESCKSTLHDGSEWIDATVGGPFGPANDLLTWIKQSIAEIRQVKGAIYKVADNHASLEAFLRLHGLPSMFKDDDFDDSALGICSFVDKQVQWAVEATPTVLLAQGTGTEHAAFAIPRGGFDLYTVGLMQQRVIALHLEGGGRLWLMPGADQPTDPVELLHTVLSAMARCVPKNALYAEPIESVIVPAVNIASSTSIDCLEGIELDGYWLTRAAQRVNILLNPSGIPVQSDGVLAVRRNLQGSVMVVDEPITGWFTQAGSSIPECVFHTHSNSWERVV